MSIHLFSRFATRLAGFVLAALLLTMTVQAHAAICRVTADADGSGTGQDPGWADPMTLQQALGVVSCNEIWVKAGIYIPGHDVDDTFLVGPGVALYGGFAGTETAREQRDPAVNVTVLSGDMSGNDVNDDGNGIDEDLDDHVDSNSRHVMRMVAGSGTHITASTRIDGVTITAGNGYVIDDEGGGLRCVANAVDSECSPTINNVTFSGNYTEDMGGAMAVIAESGGVSNPLLSNVTFRGNATYAKGAALNINGAGGTCHPRLYNVTFSGNHDAQRPGQPGTTMYGGAMYISDASASLYNTTFSGNSADKGGAIYALNASLELHDTILWGNTAANYPQLVTAGSGQTLIDHSVIEGAFTGGVWDSNLGTNVGDNSPSDPQLGVLGVHGGVTATYLLGDGSSARDAGSNRCWSDSLLAIDQRGLSRPQGASCDIGAVEMPYAVTLTVGSISGFGSVSAAALPVPLSGAIVGCGNAGSCRANYAQNTLVQLVATPAIGSLFTGWGGDCSGAGLQFNVLMDAAKSCNASFTIDPNAALVLAVDDGQHYAQVGDWLTYGITITNYSGSALNEIIVTNVLPTQLHSASWQCMPTQGATCTAFGSGQLTDTINLPAYSSVFYVFTAQVQAGSSDTVVNLVDAARDSGTTTATDTTTLVIFRNGFDGDGATQGMIAAPTSLALGHLTATGSVSLPPVSAPPPRQVGTLAASTGGSVRVESVRVGNTLWLRLITCSDGAAHYSKWSPLTDATARVRLTTDARGVRRVRLVGTRAALEAPAPASTTQRAAH